MTNSTPKVGDLCKVIRHCTVHNNDRAAIDQYEEDKWVYSKKSFAPDEIFMVVKLQEVFYEDVGTEAFLFSYLIKEEVYEGLCPKNIWSTFFEKVS